MKRLMMLIVCVIFAAISDGSSVRAQSVYPDRPMKLRVTGMLLPTDGPKREDLITIPIFVQDVAWLLRIGKVEELNPSGREEKIKEDLLLRQVRFYGPDVLLARMQQGKTLTIEGQLDAQARRFLVTEITEATAPSSSRP
jgi:hypothetical protein